MMSRAGALLAAIAATLLSAAPAAAAEPPPGSAMSDNLEYVTRVAGTERVVEGKFDRVGGKDVLVLTGRFGFKTLDVSDPENPKPMDTFLPKDIGSEFGYWQNEDMELDTERKLIIGSLDPRHDDGRAFTTCPRPGGSVREPGCRSGFFVISYADPGDMKQIGDLVELPSGHTSSCIDGCRFLWTGGPARRSDQGYLGAFTPGGRGDGRPIWVTDLRKPSKPHVFKNPIDLWRNDGLTDYSHDVNVDARGVAWVSGRGGIRGYATSGDWRDPYTDEVRAAKPWNPVLIAGGGVGGTNQPVMFMHNSERPTDGTVNATGVAPGNVLIGTEEDFTEPCANSGRIVLSDITDSLGGEGAANSTPAAPYRMTPLDTFHPAQDAGETTGTTGCSAHYFELKGSMLGAAWYNQGLRLVDVSNARNVRQVGYYRVTGTGPENPTSNSWDVEWRGNLVYLFDMSRGVEVLRVNGSSAARASARMRAVSAPAQGKDRFASVATAGLGGSGLVCPLFVDSPAMKAAKAARR